jgi:hypothetical protein
VIPIAGMPIKGLMSSSRRISSLLLGRLAIRAYQFARII